jgi:hypothetical protein
MYFTRSKILKLKQFSAINDSVLINQWKLIYQWQVLARLYQELQENG